MHMLCQGVVQTSLENIWVETACVCVPTFPGILLSTELHVIYDLVPMEEEYSYPKTRSFVMAGWRVPSPRDLSHDFKEADLRRALGGLTGRGTPWLGRHSGSPQTQVSVWTYITTAAGPDTGYTGRTGPPTLQHCARVRHVQGPAGAMVHTDLFSVYRTCFSVLFNETTASKSALAGASF